MTVDLTPDVRYIAVLGDIGAQTAALRNALTRLGAHPDTLTLPSGLAVIQVGDLVRAQRHDGLDNDATVHLAQQAWEANPGRWIQLFGNHDLALIGGPTHRNWAGPPTAAEATVRLLHDWWTTRRAHLAVGLYCQEYGDVLISHAGLARDLWIELGEPATASAAAALINATVGAPVATSIRGGRLTGADTTAPDVTWAQVDAEFYQPWLAAGDMPFTQIHGHASPWNWPANTWWPETPHQIRAATTIDAATRRTTTALATSRVAVSVDWNLGNLPTATTWPVLTVTPLRGSDAPTWPHPRESGRP